MYLIELYNEMKTNDNLDDKEKMLVSVLPMLSRFASKYVYLLKSTDEILDIQQDLIVFTYEVMDKYNPDKGCKFSTYLRTRLLDFNKDFTQKYLGIKATRWDYKKYKQKHGEELRFYFDEYKYEEE